MHHPLPRQDLLVLIDGVLRPNGSPLADSPDTNLPIKLLNRFVVCGLQFAVCGLRLTLHSESILDFRLGWTFGTTLWLHA